jgi:hypothetical protein
MYNDRTENNKKRQKKATGLAKNPSPTPNLRSIKI